MILIVLCNIFKNVVLHIRGSIASKINGTSIGVRLLEELQHSVMKFDRSNKFDFCYYGQVNSLRLKSSVTSKLARERLWGYHLFCWRLYIKMCSLFTETCLQIHCRVSFEALFLVANELKIRYQETNFILFKQFLQKL